MTISTEHIRISAIAMAIHRFIVEILLQRLCHALHELPRPRQSSTLSTARIRKAPDDTGARRSLESKTLVHLGHLHGELIGCGVIPKRRTGYPAHSSVPGGNPSCSRGAGIDHFRARGVPGYYRCQTRL